MFANWSTAFSSALIMACGPVFTLLILHWAGLERLSHGQVAGVALACAGVLVFLSDKLLGAQWQAGGGDLVLLVAASLFSYYTVGAKPLILRHGGVVVMAYAVLLGCVPAALLALPAGHLADTRSRKQLILVMTLLVAGTFYVYTTPSILFLTAMIPFFFTALYARGPMPPSLAAGDLPVQRLNARLNELCSAKPSRYATSATETPAFSTRSRTASDRARERASWKYAMMRRAGLPVPEQVAVVTSVAILSARSAVIAAIFSYTFIVVLLQFV